MKKTIYISGVITANLLLIGCIFKVNHWPGAGVALTISLAALSFWFLPAALINHYNGQKEKNNKWLYIATFISFFVVFVAALFKIQHWPGAGILLLIGVPIPFILFLPFYIYYSIKNKEQPATNFTAIILGLTFIAVFSVLLAVNVSYNVLYHGVSLIKSNENVIDFYEMKVDNLMMNNVFDAKQISDIKQVQKMSSEICSLIQDAKKDLLTYSNNKKLSGDIGNINFTAENINELQNRASQYVLIWKEGALIPVIENKIKLFTEYLNSLKLTSELLNTINLINNLDITSIQGEKYSWREREFAADYMVFALEALSRWEKNIRFIESEVIANIQTKTLAAQK